MHIYHTLSHDHALYIPLLFFHRYDWILTIVLSVVVPLYLLSGWLHARASVGFAQIRRQALQEATEVSLLIIIFLLYVYNCSNDDSTLIFFFPSLDCCWVGREYWDSFFTWSGAENVWWLRTKDQETYQARIIILKGSEATHTHALTQPIDPSIPPCRRALALSPLSGLSQTVLLLGYIIAFRFGAYQVTLDRDDIFYAKFRDVLRVFAALVFASTAIGLSGSLSPDYALAKISAKRILKILERKPNPDGYSNEGAKLVRTACSVQWIHQRDCAVSGHI